MPWTNFLLYIYVFIPIFRLFFVLLLCLNFKLFIHYFFATSLNLYISRSQPRRALDEGPRHYATNLPRTHQWRRLQWTIAFPSSSWSSSYQNKGFIGVECFFCMYLKNRRGLHYLESRIIFVLVIFYNSSSVEYPFFILLLTFFLCNRLVIPHIVSCELVCKFFFLLGLLIIWLKRLNSE